MGVTGLSWQGVLPNLGNSLFCRKSMDSYRHSVASIILVQLLKHFHLLFGIIGGSYFPWRLSQLFCFPMLSWVGFRKKDNWMKHLRMEALNMFFFPGTYYTENKSRDSCFSLAVDIRFIKTCIGISHCKWKKGHGIFEFGLIWQNNDKQLNTENRLIFSHVRISNTTENNDIYAISILALQR